MESPSRVLARQPPATVAPLEDDARLQLKQEITTLIEPYRTLADKPPFSAAELIVIAILCFDCHPAGPTTSEILQYIILLFRYYITKSVQEYANDVEDPLLLQPYPFAVKQVSMVVDGFWRALADYDVPLTVTRHMENDKEVDRYTVMPAEARMFLRNRLEPHRRGTFAFLALPPELRNRVYEYLLPLSVESGLTIAMCNENESREFKLAFLLRERANGAKPRISPYSIGLDDLGSLQQYGRGASGVHAPALGDHLAVLSTCRQIYQEAMPLFYSLTQIHFHGMPAIDRYLVKGPAQRINKLSKITITLGERSKYEALPATVQTLARIEHLTELKIGMYWEQEWLDMPRHYRQLMGRRSYRTWKGFKDIPGMLELAEVVSNVAGFDADVHIQGGCPEFKKFIKDEMEILKDPLGGTAAEKRARVKKAEVKAKKAIKANDQVQQSG